MPSPPRILLPNSSVFITTRMQEGLPLIPAEFIKVILKGKKLWYKKLWYKKLWYNVA